MTQTNIQQQNTNISDLNITGPASGFRDFLGIEAEKRFAMIQKIVEIYKSFGYLRLETPVIEKNETLRGKGGTESEKLIYDVQDPSKESSLGLRFDLTVPLARFVAQNAGQLGLPFKRFAYGDVFRGEAASMKKGRLRGFMQCDLDCVGISSNESDLEILMVMIATMEGLGVPAIIRVNNRKILDSLTDTIGLDGDEKAKKLFIGLIDDVEKAGLEKTLSLVFQNFGEEAKNITAKYLNVNGNYQQVLDGLREIIGDSQYFSSAYENLSNIFTCITALGFSEKVKLDPIIARGLDYYTGIIYETQVIGMEELGSVCSGGRYDKLIETLGGPNLPAVGTSVGVDRLLIALERLGKLDSLNNETKVYIVSFDTDTYIYSLKIAKLLREQNYNVIVPLKQGMKIAKQFAESNKLSCQYTVIVGEEEMKNSGFKVKNMMSGIEKFISIENIGAGF